MDKAKADLKKGTEKEVRNEKEKGWERNEGERGKQTIKGRQIGLGKVKIDGWQNI